MLSPSSRSVLNVDNCSSLLSFHKNDDGLNSVQSFTVGAVHVCQKDGMRAEVVMRVRVLKLCREEEKIYRVFQKSRCTESICECKLM